MRTAWPMKSTSGREYYGWITSAKQEETRELPLEKSIEILKAGIKARC
jgi:hypothetical protein